MYALYTFRWRLKKLKERDGSRYDDPIGPVVLTVILIGGMIAILCVAWTHDVELSVAATGGFTSLDLSEKGGTQSNRTRTRRRKVDGEYALDNHRWGTSESVAAADVYSCDALREDLWCLGGSADVANARALAMYDSVQQVVELQPACFADKSDRDSGISSLGRTLNSIAGKEGRSHGCVDVELAEGGMHFVHEVTELTACKPGSEPACSDALLLEKETSQLSFVRHRVASPLGTRARPIVCESATLQSQCGTCHTTWTSSCSDRPATSVIEQQSVPSDELVNSTAVHAAVRGFHGSIGTVVIGQSDGVSAEVDASLSRLSANVPASTSVNLDISALLAPIRWDHVRYFATTSYGVKVAGEAGQVVLKLEYPDSLARAMAKSPISARIVLKFGKGATLSALYQSSALVKILQQLPAATSTCGAMQRQ
jgi:hypothetical protein